MQKNRTYHPRGKLVDGLPVREHPLYGTWMNVVQRCLDPKHPSYKNYGGRGITVCERWHHFENFVVDVGPKPSPELTLDRKDNTLGYNKENCRWATRSEQAMNRRVFKNNSSGERGVSFSGNLFHVRVTVSGKRLHVGRFKTLELALAAKESFIKGLQNEEG